MAPLHHAGTAEDEPGHRVVRLFIYQLLQNRYRPLTAALRDRDSSVRQQAAQALGQLADHDTGYDDPDDDNDFPQP